MLQSHRDSVQERINSIDFLRGIVMVLMALDHVRDYFFHGSFFRDPTDLATTTSLLFLTRWITHFCAPAFVFLAGISACLYILKTDNKSKSAFFLFSRGIYLIFLELVVVNFAWTFDITFSFQLLQVLWAMGFSLIFLSFAIFLPVKIIFFIGIFIISTHNLLDSVYFSGNDPVSILWYTLHQSRSIMVSGGNLVSFTYPVLPWIGIIFLGYSFGALYKPGFDNQKRKRILLYTGVGSLLLFIILRLYNFYGDPSLWSQKNTILYSIFSFLNTSKYPPSLLFTLMTMGPALIFLALFEDINNRISRFFITFGRVPMFYYVLHLYLIHFLAILGLIVYGGNWREMILTSETFKTASLYNYGYNLLIVYSVWVLTVILLYPLCRRFGKFKIVNKAKWWVKYL